jgi:hypothetical protein
MANYLAKYHLACVDSELRLLLARIVFGAAVVTSSDENRITITRTGAGLYKAALGQPYNKLLGFNVTIGLSSGVSGATFEIIDDANVTSTSDPSFTFRAVNTAGAVADPANGTIGYLEVIVRNSATKRKGA